MKKQYLFRAERSDNGQMVEGYHVYYSNIDMHVICETKDATITHCVVGETIELIEP